MYLLDILQQFAHKIIVFNTMLNKLEECRMITETVKEKNGKITLCWLRRRRRGGGGGYVWEDGKRLLFLCSQPLL